MKYILGLVLGLMLVSSSWAVNYFALGLNYDGSDGSYHVSAPVAIGIESVVRLPHTYLKVEPVMSAPAGSFMDSAQHFTADYVAILLGTKFQLPVGVLFVEGGEYLRSARLSTTSFTNTTVTNTVRYGRTTTTTGVVKGATTVEIPACNEAGLSFRWMMNW
jgi:hypothetical protein